jgi:hypothetical protein
MFNKIRQDWRIEKKGTRRMAKYPLYDVPYLVREPNGYFMSVERYKIEVFNQAVVDDYFIARDRGLNHREARIEVALKHRITEKEVDHIRRWFYWEAQRRKKYDFLRKFPFW